MTVREVAGALGLTERAVYARLAKSRDILRRRLAPLALGAVIAASPSTAALDPPAGLAADLLRIVRRGSALGSLTGATTILLSTGSALAMKKATAAIVVLALLTALGGSIALWPESSPKDGRSREDSHVSASEQEGGAPALLAARPEETTSATKATAPSPPLAGVHGVCLDERGEPLAGAEVHLFGTLTREELAALEGQGYRGLTEGKYSFDGTADAAGQFAFDGLAPDRVGLSLAMEGYYTSGYLPLEMEGGATAWQELRALRNRRITARIEDANGVSLATGAFLFRLMHCENPPVEFGLHHSYKYAGFPADDRGICDTGFTIHAEQLAGRLRGGNESLAWAEGYGARWKPTEVEEVDDCSVRVLYRLEPEMPVTLRVVDTQGRPIQGAEVDLGGLWFPAPAAVTDTSGSARVEHMPPKYRTLRVSKKGFPSAEVAIAPGASTGLEVVLANLDAGIVSSIEWTGNPAESLRQRVRRELEELNEKGEFHHAALKRSSEDPFLGHGQLTYWPVHAGTFRLRYSHGNEEFLTEPFPFDGKENLEIVLPIDLQLEPQAIVGHVVDERTEKPAAGTAIEVFWNRVGEARNHWPEGVSLVACDRRLFLPRPPGHATHVKVAADGSFVVPFPRGEEIEVRLVARNATPEWYNDPESSDLWWSEPLDVPIGAGEIQDGVELRIRPTGRVVGRVVHPDGSSAPGEAIVLYGGSVVRAASSKTDGRFELSGIPAGRYMVENLGRCSLFGCSTGGGMGLREPLPTPGEFFDFRVEVRSGETTQVDFDLGRDGLGVVEGEIAEELGTYAHVGYLRFTRGRWVGRSPFGGRADVVARRFRAHALFPGRYRFFLEDGRKLTATADVDVVRGALLPIRLEPPRGGVVVPLAAADGSPLAGVRLARAAWRPKETIASEEEWTRWRTAGAEIVRADGTAIAAGAIPPGEVRIQVVSSGMVTAWSDTVAVSERGFTDAPVLELARGAELRITFTASGGHPVPDDLEVSIYREQDADENAARAIDAGRPYFEEIPVTVAFGASDGDSRTALVSTVGPGKYRISADDRVYGRSGRVEVAVTGQEPVAVRCELVPPESLRNRGGSR